MVNRSQSTRRRFLATTAAHVALPYFVSRSVLGAPDRPAASDRVTLGIIGCGERGNQLSDNMPSEAEVAAVCDCDTKAAGELSQRHGGTWAVLEDYRRLIDRPDLDAVIVCPTDPHHVLASILACQSGKDVYVEKPVSVYVAEGRTLVAAARKYERVVQAGTQQRTMEMNRFACELVRDGGIGRIKAVECVNFPSPRAYPGFPAESIPEGLNWNLWQGPTPDRPYNKKIHSSWWGQWRAYAGHMMTFVGAHAFDMVQYALGMDDTGPVEFWPIEEGPLAKLRFRYANGIEVRLRFEDNVRGPRLGAIFVGEDCKIEINRNKFTTNPPDFVKDGPSPDVADPWEGPGWIAKGHVQNWLDCIKTRKRPNADVEIGHRSATICHLCNITRQLQRRIRWDPVAETCPGDEEASALLNRPRRPGFQLPYVA